MNLQAEKTNGNVYQKTVRWLSYKRMAFFFCILFVISLLPVIYLAFFDYATGDDLLYGSVVRSAMREGKSFSETFMAIIDHIRWEYNTFQGTWASGFLWRLEPSIWGEKFYIVTPFISLFSLCVGPGYFLYEILVNDMKMKKSAYLVIFSAVTFMTIQYMPTPKAGIYWYTGMIQYIFAYGATMITLTWALRFADTEKAGYYIGTLLIMSYLGGAGYPEVVLGAIGFLLVICCIFCGFAGRHKRSGFLLLIPFLLEMAGFAVSAMAPGNKVRGGDEFGFSLLKVIETLAQCVVCGGKGAIKYCITVRPMFLLICLLAVITWEVIELSQSRITFSHPLAVSVILFLISAAVYAPELYAGDDVEAGISGGVFDSYYFVFILCLTLGVIYLTGWVKKTLSKRSRKSWLLENEKFAQRVRVPFIMIMFLFCLAFSRHLIGNMVDYSCVQYITSGQLADFDKQMKERLAVLEDTSVTDVVVPEMNDQQGPFMHMALLRDSTKYTNWATKLFYGKNSVIALPRDEYDELYGKNKNH